MNNTVKITWDKEAEVWVATSDYIHGLALEASSLTALIKKVRLAVHELLELNREAVFN